MYPKLCNKIIESKSGLVFQTSTVADNLYDDPPTWDFIPISPNVYKIQRSDTSYFLTASHDHLLLSENLQQDVQCWQLEPVPDSPDYYFIVSMFNKKVLNETRDIEGSDVILSDLYKGNKQQWKLMDKSILLKGIISPQQHFYNSILNKLKHSGEKYNLGVFNSLIHNGEVFPKILFYFSMKELASLKLLCRHMYQILPYYWFYKRKSLRFNGEYNDVDKLVVSGPQVINHISRIRIHLKWSDQGWGNEKTQLFLNLVREGKVEARYTLFARHQKTEHFVDLEDHRIIRQSQRGDIIEIWRYVGGGGGHEMHINILNCVIELLK